MKRSSRKQLRAEYIADQRFKQGRMDPVTPLGNGGAPKHPRRVRRAW